MLEKHIEKIIEVAEKDDFDVTVSEHYITVSKYSPAGQDFSFTIENSSNIDDFLNKIYDCYESYDVSYETSLWLDDFGHGKNGAPYELEDVLEDMKSCEQYILDFYNIVKNLKKQLEIKEN